jgi:peptidoglycan/LPS O-acetylase OafA/YrhL
VDVARVLAVSLVILYHAMAGQTTWVGRLGGAGWIGVDLFFVLSGFLVTQGFQGLRELQPDTGVGQAAAMGAFYRKRLRRIFPAYLATIVVVFLMTYPLLAVRSKALGDIPYYLVFLGNHRAIQAPILWSISVEMQFYLLLPLAWVGNRGTRFVDWVVQHPVPALGIALLLPMAWRAMAYAMFPALHGALPEVVTLDLIAGKGGGLNTSFGSIVYNSLFGHMDGLLLGTWLGLLWEDGNARFNALVHSWKHWALGIGVAGLLASYWVLSPWRTWMPRPVLLGVGGFSMVGGSCLLLVVGLRASLDTRGANGRAGRALRWVSDRIYSLYLAQALASILLGLGVAWYALSAGLGLSLAGLYVLVALAFAVPLYNLVERRLSGIRISTVSEAARVPEGPLT